MGKAVSSGKLKVQTINIRDFAHDKHKMADDRPFGGGAGMVMKPEPLCRAIEAAKKTSPEALTVFMGPGGRTFNQSLAKELAEKPGLILVSGRYEGVDERFLEETTDLEISIGDFVLSAGEPAAMAVADAVARLVPGVLGNSESLGSESFESGLLEYAQYTRPREFRNRDVPEILFSGNHQAISDWRMETALLRTLIKRPDLLMEKGLDRNKLETLEKWGRRINAITRAQSLCGASSSSGDE